MIEEVKLAGGPADGRKLMVKDQPKTITVGTVPRHDPTRPRRRQPREGRRKHRYRRTSQGTGSGLIPKRYIFVP